MSNYLTLFVWGRIPFEVAICYRIAGHFKHAAKEGRAYPDTFTGVGVLLF